MFGARSTNGNNSLDPPSSIKIIVSHVKLLDFLPPPYGRKQLVMWGTHLIDQEDGTDFLLGLAGLVVNEVDVFSSHAKIDSC
jgi:hypothetical protein